MAVTGAAFVVCGSGTTTMPGFTVPRQRLTPGVSLVRESLSQKKLSKITKLNPAFTISVGSVIQRETLRQKRISRIMKKKSIFSVGSAKIFTQLKMIGKSITSTSIGAVRPAVNPLLPKMAVML
ncbi:hypothetical protein N7540_005331 [Penicillium herquei]|nr:hypothetical protein N7540_005331 [Penicillium herquei]